MSLEYEGYLSEEIDELGKIIFNNSRKGFDLLKKINNYSHSLKYQLDIHNTNIQEISVTILFVSLINSLSSLNFLLQKGLIDDSKIILRIMLEKTIKLKYLCLDYEHARHYVLESERERLKLMNVVLSNPDVFSEEVKQSITEEERDLLKKEILENNIPEKKSIEELSKLTGMQLYYQNVYRILNTNVHSNFKSIERKLGFNSNNEVISINWIFPPEDLKNEVDILLFTANTLACTGIESVIDLFEVNDKGIEVLVKELKALRMRNKKYL